MDARALRSRRRLLLPAASALLLALAHPPLDLPALAFTGLVPFALYLHACPPGRAGRWAALNGSLLFGALHFGLLLHWMPLALVDLSWLAIPGWLTVVLGLSTLMAGVGWLVWASVGRLGLPLALALPVAWTAGEWVRGNLPLGLAFPWLELGVSLSAFPEAAGGAELVGSRGLSFWMAAVNGLLAGAVVAWGGSGAGGGARRGARAGAAGRLAAAALLVALPVLWGVRRAGSLEVRPAARVAVVQPGVGAELRRDPEAGWAATRAAVDGLLPALAADSADLVVLPEVVLRGFPEDPEARGALASFFRWSRTLEAPVLFGAFGRGEGGRGGAAGPTRTNSAFLAAGEALTPFRYDKRRLVPGVERVPVGSVGLVPEAADFEAGEGAPLLVSGRGRHGVLICYEALYPELARRYRRAGADLLLNLTNDAWFGGGDGRRATTALRQHPAHLVLRAIENRMGVARAAATGISLFVDPVGRVHEATRPGVAAVRVLDPGTTRGLTVYARFGDLVGTGSALLALVLAAGSLVRGRGRRTVTG